MQLPGNKDPIGNGWGYPIRVYRGGIARSGAPKGVEVNDTYRIQVVRQAIREIVFTVIREWIMRRSFGSEVHRSQFQPLQTAATTLESRVVRAILKYEKRITGVTVNTDLVPDDGAVQVTVSYMIIKTGAPDTMVFPWYLEEAGK